jgi:FkbM family methyltransferase
MVQLSLWRRKKNGAKKLRAYAMLLACALAAFTVMCVVINIFLTFQSTTREEPQQPAAKHIHNVKKNNLSHNNNIKHGARSTMPLAFDPSTSCATLSSNFAYELQRDRGYKVEIDHTQGVSFSIQVYRNHDFVSNHIRNGIGFENEKVEALQRHFTEYSEKHNIPLSELTFLDIGANIGWFSFQMAALGVQVIAFEPMEQNLDLIKASLCLSENMNSGLSKQITLFGYGLGVEDGECMTFSHRINKGDGHVECDASRLELPEDYEVRGSIPVRRLDDIMSKFQSERGKLNVVAAKIDIEGSEAKMMEGGEKFLLGGEIPVIVTEFDPRMIRERGSDPVDFMKKIFSAGYRVEGNRSDEFLSLEDMMDIKRFGQGLDLTLRSPASF